MLGLCIAHTAQLVWLALYATSQLMNSLFSYVWTNKLLLADQQNHQSVLTKTYMDVKDEVFTVYFTFTLARRC